MSENVELASEKRLVAILANQLWAARKPVAVSEALAFLEERGFLGADGAFDYLRIENSADIVIAELMVEFSLWAATRPSEAQ